MADTNSLTDWDYRTLLIIWASSLATPVLIMLLLFWTQPGIFQFDHSQPFIGERYIIVPVAVLMTIWDLFFSFYRHNNYLRESITDKNPELVRTALITATSSTIIISLYGFFLAWIFEYQYFFVWVLVGFVATLFYFPRRSHLTAAHL